MCMLDGAGASQIPALGFLPHVPEAVRLGSPVLVQQVGSMRSCAPVSGPLS